MQDFSTLWQEARENAHGFKRSVCFSDSPEGLPWWLVLAVRAVFRAVRIGKYARICFEWPWIICETGI